MSDVQVVVLAAGMGTRLGRPHPKPLTRLRDGRTILGQQLDHVRASWGTQTPVTVVVGFQAEVLMAAAPGLNFVHNPHYATSNTSKSLLRALEELPPGGVLWMNGDVVFDPRTLDHVRPWVDADVTFVCVDTSVVADEEVKYRIDADGFISELSKTVVDGLGEAVGINYVASADREVLIKHLRAVGDQDYFERGIETAIEAGVLHVRPVDISHLPAVEVDVEDDLVRADALEWLALAHPGPAATVLHPLGGRRLRTHRPRQSAGEEAG